MNLQEFQHSEQTNSFTVIMGFWGGNEFNLFWNKAVTWQEVEQVKLSEYFPETLYQPNKQQQQNIIIVVKQVFEPSNRIWFSTWWGLSCSCSPGWHSSQERGVGEL